MSKNNNIYRLVLTAMFAALTYLTTSVIKIPTPSGGYVHIGDGFVLLSGLFLGPLWGGLAAGLGSALADLLGGYIIYIPGTFVIKALAAVAASLTWKAVHNRKGHAAVLYSSVAGEFLVWIGYIIYDIFFVALMNGTFSTASLQAALFYKLSSFPIDCFQLLAGIIIAVALAPVLQRISRRYPVFI